MQVRVLAIEPQAEPGSFDVVVARGAEQRTFHLVMELVPLGTEMAQMVQDDDALPQYLNGHFALDVAIRKLVARRYNGKPVRLPAVVGRIEAPEPVVLP